jgi:predicted metal-binding protein
MKIAILHCRKSMDVCTGAACFKAYNHDLASFAQYAGDRPELAAFFDCGGCGIDRAQNAGVLEKLERLKSEGVEKVHVGVCVGHKCPEREEILALLDRYGLPYEFGTHR